MDSTFSLEIQKINLRHSALTLCMFLFLSAASFNPHGKAYGDASSFNPYGSLLLFLALIALSFFPRIHKIILAVAYLTAAYFAFGGVVLAFLINIEITQYSPSGAVLLGAYFLSSGALHLRATLRLFWAYK